MGLKIQFLLCVQCIGVGDVVKIRLLDLPVVSGVSICTCALFLLYSMAPVGASL